MDAFLFYLLAALSILASLGVILAKSPLQSALHLVLTMVAVAGLFFLLEAPFVGAVQILVYAGAVMVLFVLVLMLVDTQKEEEMFSGGTTSIFTKGLFAGALAGLIAALAYKTVATTPALAQVKSFPVSVIAKVLFTKYVLSFEALGVMLLVIPIGVVALSRVKGGTHDR